MIACISSALICAAKMVAASRKSASYSATESAVMTMDRVPVLGFVSPKLIQAALAEWRCPSAPLIASKSLKSLEHEDEDDCASCTTDETDMLSESESKFDHSDSEEEEDDSESECEETPAYAQSCGTETCAWRVHQVLRDASSHASIKLYLDDYICDCGHCPQYEAIARDVQRFAASKSIDTQTSIARLLQAYSTYNEVVGYQRKMVAIAEECLYVWYGNDQQAFKSFVKLFEEIPELSQDEGL